MIYQDFYNSSGGIYTSLSKEPIFKLNIFNDIYTPEALDKLFLYKNGLKNIDLTMEEATEIIITEYYNKWFNLITLVLNKFDGSTQVTETTNGGTSTNSNKVSAYDSEDLITDNQTETENDLTATTKVTNIEQLTNLISLYANYDIYGIIERDIRFILFDNIY